MKVTLQYNGTDLPQVHQVLYTPLLSYPYPTHTILLYKKDKKWYWFENAFDTCKGTHEFNTVKEAIECVKEKQLEYAISIGVVKETDKQYLKDWEYSKLEKSLSVSEYLKHILSNYD